MRLRFHPLAIVFIRCLVAKPSAGRCIQVLSGLKQRKRAPRAPEWPRAPAASQVPTAWAGGGALGMRPTTPRAMGEGRGAQGRAAKWPAHRPPRRAVEPLAVGLTTHHDCTACEPKISPNRCVWQLAIVWDTAAAALRIVNGAPPRAQRYLFFSLYHAGTRRTETPLKDKALAPIPAK